MIELQRGGNAPVSGQSLKVTAEWTAGAGVSADVSAYLLGAGGTVRGDHDMIFYNQTEGAGGAVKLTAAAGTTSFQIAPGSVPAEIERIVFCLTIDGEASPGHSFSSLTRAWIGVDSEVGFTLDCAGASEAAMILGELYRRGPDWKFRAVAQGFDGGLGPLARSFGIEVDDTPETAPPAPPPPPVAAPPPPPGPNLVKPPPVILTKPDESAKVSLSKGGGGKLIVTASWIDNGDGFDDNDDLDLRVGLLKADGSFVMIHAPDKPGSYASAPFVFHTGDVRQASAKAPATEIVEVNPDIAKQSGGRVGLVFSVYSAISNGAVSVPSLKPKMRMECGDQTVECAFDFLAKADEDDDFTWTYVLGTAIIDGDSISLQPSGMKSEPGAEDTPRLRWDNAGGLIVTIDGKPVFKD